MMNAEQHFIEGGYSYEIGDFETALYYYELVLQDKPNWLAAIYNTAICNYDIGQFEKSIIASNRVINSSENMLVFDALYNRGNCYHSTFEFEKAVEDFSTLILMDPKCAGAYQNRSNAYSRLGMIKLENIDSQKAKELKGDTDFDRYYITPEHEDITDEVLDNFSFDKKTLLSRNPINISERHFEKANSYIHIREFEKALELFKQAIKNYPLDFYEAAQYNLINCLMDLNVPSDIIIKEVSFYVKNNPTNKLINEYKVELERADLSNEEKC